MPEHKTRDHSPFPRRVYVFSYYFPPLGRADGQLLAQFSRLFASYGWEINVLTTGSFSPAIFGGQLDHTLEKILPEGILIRRVRHPLGALAGPFLTTLKMWDSPFAGWRKNALRNLDGLFRGPGVVYTVVPPVDNPLVAHAFARRHGLPLVVDFKDDCVGLPPEVVRDAALILGSTPVTLRNMQAHYQTSAPARVFYNGHTRSLESYRLAGPREARPVRMAYAGSTYPANMPVGFLDAARQLPAEVRNQVRLEFFSPENAYAKLKLKPQLKTPDLWHGYQPFSVLARNLAQCHVGLVSLAGDFGFAIPSKLFTCIGLGLPILAFGPEGGALQQVVEDNGLGLFSSVGDVPRLAANMQRMTLDAPFREACAANARAAADKYSIEGQIEQLHPVFNGLLPTSFPGESRISA